MTVLTFDFKNNNNTANVTFYNTNNLKKYRKSK